jgi:hypothetical protein
MAAELYPPGSPPVPPSRGAPAWLPWAAAALGAVALLLWFGGRRGDVPAAPPVPTLAAQAPTVAGGHAPMLVSSTPRATAPGSPTPDVATARPTVTRPATRRPLTPTPLTQTPASAAAADGAHGDDRPGRIEGRVRAVGNIPLEGSDVTAIGVGNGASYHTASGSDGRYSLTVPAGAYIVRAEAGGHRAEWFDRVAERSAARPLAVAPGAVVGGIDFTLKPEPDEVVEPTPPPATDAPAYPPPHEPPPTYQPYPEP